VVGTPCICEIVEGDKGHSETQNLGTAPEFPSPSTGTVMVLFTSIVPCTLTTMPELLNCPGATGFGLTKILTRCTKHHPSMYSSNMLTVSPILNGSSSERLGVNVAVTTIVRGRGLPSRPFVGSVGDSTELGCAEAWLIVLW
jgi:hypothetical protein